MQASLLSEDNITLVSDIHSGKYSYLYLYKFLPDYNLLPPVFIVLDGIRIEIPRGPTNGLLYVGIGAKKDLDIPITSTSYLGIREDNSNITLNMKLGPFVFDKKDRRIIIDYIGINKDESRMLQTLINLQDTLSQLPDQGYSLSDLYQANSIIGSISPGLTSGECNGTVFADNIFISMDDINKMVSTDSDSIEKYYQGTESPPGCGPNSKYYVEFSITPAD